MPPPEDAIPEIKELFELMSPELPDFMKVPFTVGRDIAAAEKARKKFIADYECGRFSMVPTLDYHKERDDGTFKQAQGTSGQEGKHTWMQVGLVLFGIVV